MWMCEVQCEVQCLINLELAAGRLSRSCVGCSTEKLRVVSAEWPRAVIFVALCSF